MLHMTSPEEQHLALETTVPARQATLPVYVTVLGRHNRRVQHTESEKASHRKVLTHATILHYCILGWPLLGT